MTNRFKLILFDFDGTIADTSEGILKCVRYALGKAGIEETDENRLREFLGPPLSYIFRKNYLDDEEAAWKFVRDYRELYNPEGYKLFSLYPGAEDMLRELEDRGVGRVIVSGKPAAMVRKIVEFKGITELFDGEVCLDPSNGDPDKTGVILRAMKEFGNVDPSRTVMVGDREYDIAPAKKLGLFTVGVTFGYGTAKELTDSGADALADDIAQLRKVLTEND